MSFGPLIWDFRTCFNIETVGAQSQASMRENSENKILFSAVSPHTYKRTCDRMYNAILLIKRSVVVQNAAHSVLTLAFSLSPINRFHPVFFTQNPPFSSSEHSLTGRDGRAKSQASMRESMVRIKYYANCCITKI